MIAEKASMVRLGAEGGREKERDAGMEKRDGDLKSLHMIKKKFTIVHSSEC